MIDGDKIINGKIFLDMKKEYPAQQVVFQIKGKEKVNWIEKVYKMRINWD